MYARSLSRLALVFGVLYVVLVVSAAIPPRLLDYVWISRVTATLINGSSLPLLAVLVLVLGCRLFPEDEILQRRRDLFCRLATAAALGFLLLVPLNTYLGVIQHLSDREQSRRLDDSERQLTTYRNAVASAGSPAALQASLAKLGAPKLEPAALSLPLPELQARLRQSFDLAAAQIAERRQIVATTTNWKSRLIDILRIVAASLTLAFGFAAFARPSAQAPSLLDILEKFAARFSRQSLLQLWRKSSAKKQLNPKRRVDIHPARMPKRNLLKSFLASLNPPPRRRPRRIRSVPSPWQRLLHSLDNWSLFGRKRKGRTFKVVDENDRNAITSNDPPKRR
jgi:hypothetical protein